MLLDVYTQAIKTEMTSSRYKGQDRSFFVKHLTTMAPPWLPVDPFVQSSLVLMVSELTEERA